MNQNMNAPALVRPLASALDGFVFLFETLERFQKAKTSPFRDYDVFLIFRGPDSRTGFADFLYKGLLAAWRRVFRDEALPAGEQIGPENLRAIRTCKIVIPVISDRYTKSKCCLRELTEIMGCHRQHGKSVFPVFYGVNVDDLGRRCSNFEEALHEYNKIMQCRREEVQEWAKALRSVARIRGWTSQAIADGREEERMVKMVVAKVWSKLQITRSSSTFVRLVNLYFQEKKRRELEKKRSECQVFLAFRGRDTRDNLAAYLYTSLVAEGIKVFTDDDLSTGEDVYEIYNAIHRCKISIPIFSENFASSRWCLNALAEMVECKRTKGQNVLPIFYKVMPSHVQDLSHMFGEHMLRHKQLVEENIHEWIDKTTYERWERALKEVGSSEGWVSEKIANGDERELVNQVVKEVARLLNMH